MIGQNQLLFTKIIDFIEEFKVEEYESKKDFIDGKKDDLSRALQSISQETDKITLYKKKLNLLEEVPCGSEYSHCKFIKDAYGAKDLLQNVGDNVVGLHPSH